ncbi:MAG: phage scaffolding protein [Firmicutes bacterium]|nr:phage scaffolding protein [Bacillota bacterium]
MTQNGTESLKNEELLSMTAEELREFIAALYEKHEREMLALKLEHAADMELIKAGAYDPKAVKPFLDMEALKFEKGGLIGLEAQLKLLKTQKAFLFMPEKQKIKKTGLRQAGSEMHTDKKEEANAALRNYFGKG